ncbi:MAG: hypothetical protein AABY22_29900 [Nanoarchaeota archaeon]
MTKTAQEILELLAEVEHDQWCKWTNYFLDYHNDKENLRKWSRQARQSYSQLSEKEKDSDRKWAKIVINIFRLQAIQEVKTCEKFDFIGKVSERELCKLRGYYDKCPKCQYLIEFWEIKESELK